MKVIVKAPTEMIGHYEEIDNSLESMQKIVGGWIEIVPMKRDDISVVCNEEGKLRGMLPSFFSDYGDVIVGTVFVCGNTEDGDFTDVPITLEEWKSIIE